MGTTTFNWAPDWQAQGEFKPNVRALAFGDGYEQRTQFGINATKPKWTLQFKNRADAEGKAIGQFLKDRGALDSFFWTSPSDALASKWVCRSWTATPTGATGLATDGSLQALWTINATFEQVFEP